MDIGIKYKKFINYVDVPTKLHLQEDEGLKEYTALRTRLEEEIEIWDIVRKHPGEICFVLDSDTYEDYEKTYTDVGGSIEEVELTKEEFNKLKTYFKYNEQQHYGLPEDYNMYDMCHCCAKCSTKCARRKPVSGICTVSDFSDNCLDYKE